MCVFLFLIGCLNEVYLGEGTGIKFAILFDELAENFPENKVRRLQDFIRCKINVKYVTGYMHYHNSKIIHT